MPPPLRIVVIGDTNSGKSTLNNAIIGRELLPVGWRSETSIITYVVPQHVDIEAVPELRAYHQGAGGLMFDFTARGEKAVHDRLAEMNRDAQVAGESECIECRVDSPLRASLNVFQPPAAQWEHVQLVDIGGPDDALNPTVQACADLACALSHRLVVCVRYDQVTSRSTLQLIQEVRAKAPYHFDDALAMQSRCPLLFVVTQVDRVLERDDREGMEDVRQRLRTLLQRALPDRPVLAKGAPILVLSARQALACVGSEGSVECPAYEWREFEELLILVAGLKSDIVQDCRARRAAYIDGLLQCSLERLQPGWPYYALDLWESRREVAVKAATYGAIAAGSIGTGVAMGVYIGVAAPAATQAAATAAAGSQTWWAWIFGQSAASTAAQAAAASTAATANAWATSSVIAGGATLSVAAAHGVASHLPATPEHVVEDAAGLRIAHAAAVGARDARVVLQGFRFSADAREIKGDCAYRDVLFYPDGIVPAAVAPSELARVPWPFQLRSARHGGFLTQEGCGVTCSRAQDRSGQLWWVVPAADGGFVLRNAATSDALGAEEAGSWAALLDSRMSVRCTSEEPAKEWRGTAGEEAGTVRLVGTDHEQALYYDRWWAGFSAEPHVDQDWVVVPKIPFYVGEFVQDSVSGHGQFFWPNGAPLFKGEVREGRPHRGFVFDERSICHGHFRFVDGVPEPDGAQPEDVDQEGACLACGAPSMVRMGKALKPCSHSVVCEACASQIQECPYCHEQVEGTMRVM